MFSSENKTKLEKNPKLILITGCLLLFLTSFVGSMMTVALPIISTQMNLSISMTNAISLVYLIAAMALPVPLSVYVGYFGIKKYTLIGIVLLTFGVVMSIFSQDIWMLLLSRLVQGIAVSALAVAIHMPIASSMPEEKVGWALGIVGSSGYLGLTTAPAITGFILAFFSWQSIFIVVLPICIVIFLLILKIESKNIIEKNPVDHIGSVLFIAACVILITGLNDINTYGIISLVLSAVLFIALFIYERNRTNQLYNFGLFKNLEYVIGNVAAMISYFVTNLATSYIVTFYLSLVLHLDSIVVGLLLLINPIIMVIFSPMAGRTADKYDPKILSSIALFILMCAMIVFYFVDVLPFYFIIVGLVLQGLGQAIFSSPNNKTVLTLVTDDDLADASAMLSSCKELGKSLGVASYTAVFSFLAGVNAVLGDNTEYILTTNHSLIIVTIALLIVGIVLLNYSRIRYPKNE